jgi:hypothetical protein
MKYCPETDLAFGDRTEFGSFLSWLFKHSPIEPLQKKVGQQLADQAVQQGVSQAAASAFQQGFDTMTPSWTDVAKGLGKTVEIAAPALIAIAAPVAVPALAAALGYAAPTAAESVLAAGAATSAVVKPAISAVADAAKGIDLSGLGISAPSLGSLPSTLRSTAQGVPTVTLPANAVRPSSAAPTTVNQTGFAPLALPSQARVSSASAPRPQIDVAGLAPAFTVTGKGLIANGRSSVQSVPQWQVYGSGAVVRIG